MTAKQDGVLVQNPIDSVKPIDGDGRTSPNTENKYPGVALQIINVELPEVDPKTKKCRKDETAKVVVNKENLQQLITNLMDAKAERISVVSITGPFRSGKSFMLDLFIRYLTSTMNSGKEEYTIGKKVEVYDHRRFDWTEGVIGGTPDNLTIEYTQSWDKGDGNAPQESQMSLPLKDKLDSKHIRTNNRTEWFLPSEDDSISEQQDGLFDWREAEDRHTTGIWVYSHPFMRTLPGSSSNEQVAVILMDTQGLFDKVAPPGINQAVVGLSALLSSNAIYNVKNQIQENTLEAFDFFTESALGAIDALHHGDGAERQEEGKVSEQRTPLQRVSFLIRDWQNFKCDELNLETARKAVIADGQKSLDKTLGDRAYDDGKMRERLKTAYEKITCALLPYPGKAMVQKRKRKGDGRGFGIRAEHVDAEFSCAVKCYVPWVFEEEIVAKRSLTEPERYITPLEFQNYVEQLTEAFENGAMPVCSNLVLAYQKAQNLSAKDEAQNLLSNEIETLRDPNGQYMRKEDLQEKKETLNKMVLEKYDSMTKFGDKEAREEVRQQLVEKIKSEIKHLDQINRDRVKKILTRFKVWVAFAVVAFIVDKISDYACDWYLDICRQMSKLLFTGYVIVFTFMAYQVGMLYTTHDEGIWAEALSGLCLDVLPVMMDYRNQLTTLVNGAQNLNQQYTDPAVELAPMGRAKEDKKNR